jgi:AraC family transcriptional regulator of adaptative response/methylated-DNA-[protein]-cysteine methyltransferase
MTEQNKIDYLRIAKAIEYIRDNFKQQPDLTEVAGIVNLSPYHFQKLFTDWAGVSPKKFLQYLTVKYAKSLLHRQQATLFETTFESGLSAPSRLHDLFVKIEGMTPGEYKTGGENLSIRFSFSSSLFGDILIASTEKGICHIAFVDKVEKALCELKLRFPKALLTEGESSYQRDVTSFFAGDWSEPKEIKLYLRGTQFQLKVWEALLNIPAGELRTYGRIAREIEFPTASKAVGTAVGANPIAFLIPCHRVINSSGIIGDYRWGSVRKTALIGWEAARSDLRK